ncbi:hypothetical protein MXB_2348, partial [Myxobolus squamalis]
GYFKTHKELIGSIFSSLLRNWGFYFYFIEDWQKAETSFSHSISTFSNDPITLIAHGICLLNMNQSV